MAECERKTFKLNMSPIIVAELTFMGSYYARCSFYSWDLSCHHSQLQNEHFTLSVVFIVGTF